MIIFTIIMIIPYALSTWLIWQNLKLDTVLPHGSTTGIHGYKIGWGIKFLYFGILISLTISKGLVYLFSFPIIWFLGGWLATLFERKLYMDSVLKLIEELADFYKDSDPKYAVMMLIIPEWWLKLMPKSWRKKYFLPINAFK